MAIVYRHRRLDTNKIFYIGIGKTKRRITSKDSRNKYWKNIINKTRYDSEIIAENLTWEDACELESFLIQLYGRKDNNTGILSNMTDGGDGSKGFKHTEEFKEKIKIKMHNRKISDKTRLKMSESAKNRPFSKNQIEILRNANLGKKLSENHKLKLSKTVLQYDLNDNFIKEYKSLSEASKITNTQCGHISKVCKNIRKTAGGYKWKYKNE